MSRRACKTEMEALMTQILYHVTLGAAKLTEEAAFVITWDITEKVLIQFFGEVPIAPNIHCVEILRTIQCAENWREKNQIKKWKASISPHAENLKPTN